jgi:hypothetical protein
MNEKSFESGPRILGVLAVEALGGVVLLFFLLLHF